MTRKALCWGLVLGLTAWMSSTALAIFDPPEGELKFKITDAGNFYDPVTLQPDPRSPLFLDAADMDEPAEQAAYQAALNAALVGRQDFTAFRVTSYTIDGGSDQPIPAGSNLVGVLTFLQVHDVTVLDEDTIRVRLADSVRDHQVAGGGIDPLTGGITIGRFFLFDIDTLNAGLFDVAGGQPGDVDFSSGFGDQRVSSNGADFFEIDILANFVDALNGGDLITDRFLLSGSIVTQDLLGTVPLLLNRSNIPGVAFTGNLPLRDLLIDGGAWFDDGLVDRATFQVNLIGYDGTVTPSAPFPGDPGVFDGGWQISTEDPVTMQIESGIIPEPATAGMGILAAFALMGWMTRRRAA